MGQNTLQDYPPMMFSEGVMTDRITLEEMVAVTSTNAAKIFGMYPRKGVIRVGSDEEKDLERQGPVLESRLLDVCGQGGHRTSDHDDPPRRGGLREREDPGQAWVGQVHSR